MQNARFKLSTFQSTVPYLHCNILLTLSLICVDETRSIYLGSLFGAKFNHYNLYSLGTGVTFKIGINQGGELLVETY